MSELPNTQQAAEYIRELKNFDWNFQYADDYSAVKRGYIALAQLHAQQRSIDPTGEVWLKFMPADSSHTPSVVREKANG